MRIAQSSAVPLTLLLVACSSDQKATHQKPDGPPVGHWEKLPDGPVDALATGHTFFDHEYIAWSGGKSPLTPFIFDAASDSWRIGNSNGCPTERLYASAVWTGSEVVFWGGKDNDYLPTENPNGAYNPATDTWRLISNVNAPSPREWVTPIWTGTEMIIWGGADTRSDYNNPPILADAYAYNPAIDAWRTIPSQGAPSPRIEVMSAWTGRELLVWGGTADSNQIRQDLADRAYLKSGGAYDPVSDSWRPMATEGAPSQNRPTVSAWTGAEFLIWNSLKAEGAAYNPSADKWRSIDARGPLLPHGSCHTWTGEYFLVCGDQVEPDGEIYDPAKDLWFLMESQLVDAGPGAWGQADGYAYAGDAYIFGGFYGGDLNVSDLWGYRYVIPSDSADAQP